MTRTKQWGNREIAVLSIMLSSLAIVMGITTIVILCLLRA